MWCCMWGRRLRGNSAACSTVCWFSVPSPATHNQIGPFWCWFLVGWVCVCSRILGSLQRTLLWGWEFLLLLPQPPQVFSVRGFEALFPWTGSLDCAVYLLPSCSSQFICRRMWDHPVCQPPPYCESSLPGCPSPPFLQVWMNASLTRWLSDFPSVQFSVSSGCFLFLNLLLSFFWLCEEAQCVYLCLHLGQKSEKYNFNIIFNFFLLFCFQWDDDVSLFHFLLLLVNITSHRKVGV